MASRRRRTTEVLYADGANPRWFETYKALVVEEDDTVLGTAGVSRDISAATAEA